MIKRLKNTFLLYTHDMSQLIAVIGTAWLVGMIFAALILNFSKEPPETYMNMAFLFSMIVGMITVFIVDVMFYAINFNIAVSMGISRKRFLIDVTIVLFIQHIIYIMFLLVLYQLENLIAKLFYGNLNFEKDMVVISGINLLQMLGVAAAAVAVSIFVGAMLQRFGKVAFWIMWGAYMFFAVGGVGLLNVANSNTVIGSAIKACQNFFTNLSGAGVLTIIAIFCTILAGIGVLIFRKAVVK